LPPTAVRKTCDPDCISCLAEIDWGCEFFSRIATFKTDEEDIAARDPMKRGGQDRFIKLVPNISLSTCP